MIIYEPRGKALEYSPLAANIYRGCSHACEYCFAPSATFCLRQRFSDPGYIQPRKDVMAQLGKDAKKLAGDERPILLSFTSDPYQELEKSLKFTRRALSILSANNLKPQILTKAGAWAIHRDADILSKAGGIWAATLTTDDDAESLQWEPGAAWPGDRIEALRVAKSHGLQTWVSFEPVINPSAVQRLIHTTKDFVDLYKVGKLNYHPHAKTIDWAKFRDETVDLLQKLGKDYYVKNDLRNA